MTNDIAQGLAGLLVTLLLVTVVAGVSGCGLKGDLYLAEPPAEPSQAPAGRGTDSAAAADAIPGEAPDETSELVNSEAAMDADPGSADMEPGGFSDLEGPGDTAAEQADSEAAMGTDPGSVVTEPVDTIELKESAKENGEESEDTIEDSVDVSDTTATTKIETDSGVSQTPGKEEQKAVAPTQ